MTVSEALFCVSVGYFGWVGIILGGWRWLGHYFGWLEVGGKTFWVGGSGWG